jgi:hypothetical protein
MQGQIVVQARRHLLEEDYADVKNVAVCRPRQTLIHIKENCLFSAQHIYIYKGRTLGLWSIRYNVLV